MGRITWHGAKAGKKVRSKLSAHIGGKLFKLRQKHQISMRDLSKSTGLSNAFICQLENGQSAPTAETLWRLCKHFEVPVGYFFKGYTD